MMKMQIAFDEQKLLKDNLDINKVWGLVDSVFEHIQAIKEIQEDGSVMYLNNPARVNTMSDFGIAYVNLHHNKILAQYCTKWILFENEEDETKEFYNENVLKREREKNPLFAKFVR